MTCVVISMSARDGGGRRRRIASNAMDRMVISIRIQPDHGDGWGHRWAWLATLVIFRVPAWELTQYPDVSIGHGFRTLIVSIAFISEADTMLPGLWALRRRCRTPSRPQIDAQPFSLQ